MSKPPKKQITVAQAAERMGLSTKRILQFIYAGRLHEVGRVGFLVMLDPDEVTRFKRKKRINGRPIKARQ